MIAPEEPKRPEPSPEVCAWFDERDSIDRTVPLDDFKAKYGRDLPPFVLAYVDEHDAWMRAHDAWRAKLPIDSDWMSGRVRFFGGDWLAHHEIRSAILEAAWDNTRYIVIWRDAIMAAYARMNEDEFRVFVAGVYEHLRMRAAAEVALVKHLRSGEGR